jgi:hypothetical protein
VTAFCPEVFQSLASAVEVQVIVPHRETGARRPVTIWITPHQGRLYIRSGAGLGRQWVQNLLAYGGGEIHYAGLVVPFQARHVTDVIEARSVAMSVARKYHGEADVVGIASRPADATPLPAETATFEVLPAVAASEPA